MALPHMLRNVEGIDTSYTLMPAADIDKLLQDPFARLALLPLDVASRPLTLNQVTQAMVPAGTTAYQGQSFFVGDGSQVKYKKYPKLDRSLRYIWVRVPQNNQSDILPEDLVPINMALATDVMAVAGTDSNSATTFLQVASWDSKNQWFNYYERERDTSPPGEWVWVGNSMHAVTPATMGKGPFMGHINGSLVMKELKLPWNNWHSSQATIDACLASDDPIRQDPLFINRQQADTLQTIVESGIAAWTASRIATPGRTFNGADGNILVSVKSLLMPLFGNTTANFITSSTRSSQTDFGNGSLEPIGLPLTFFFNSDLLGNAKLPLVAAKNPPLHMSAEYVTFNVPYKEVYKPTIEKLQFSLVGYSIDPNDDKPISIPGDTFFAFLVPEVAKEDQQVVIELLKSTLLSPRFVTCVLMVDFVNPVYSTARLQLLDLALDGNDTGTLRTLETEMVGRITNAAKAGNAIAVEFMKWWQYEDTTQLASAANTAINAYLAAASKLCATADGFEQYVRLAESCRRSFVGHNTELYEFPLTFPRTSIPADAPPLCMTPSGQVVDMEPAQVALLVAAKAAQAPSRYRCEAASTVRSGGGGGCPFARRQAR